jgi:hypothetical protein
MDNTNKKYEIDTTLLKYLSFPDYPITNFEFLSEKKVLKINVKAAWLDINSGISLGPGFLLFRNWTSLTIQEFDGGRWQNLEFSESDILDEINEFTVEDSVICFSGSAKKTHKWIEWRVENSEISAEFHDLKSYSLGCLLNKNASQDERGEAAFDLHRFEDIESIQALIQVASDPSESKLVVKYCAESLGTIFSKGNLYDQKLIDRLTPQAKEIVNDIIRNKTLLS